MLFCFYFFFRCHFTVKNKKFWEDSKYIELTSLFKLVIQMTNMITWRQSYIYPPFCSNAILIFTLFSYKQKLRKLITLTNLHWKYHFLRSHFHQSKVKIHQDSQPLNYLWSETKEGCFKCKRCQHVSAKLQKISVYPGNVTLEIERILFKEALNRIETDFQKNCNTGLCTLYPQS